MSERYNHVFVLGTRLSGSELSKVLVNELSPLWDALGRPASLLAVNVDESREVLTAVHGFVDEKLLQYQPGTVFNVRGTESQMGTVQYYELASHGVVAISRPFRQLSFQQRLDWMRLLWTSLLPRGVLFAISGREVEISATDVKSAIDDWTALSGVPLGELVIVSNSVVPEPPSDATPIDHGFLVQLQADASGGQGMH